MALAQAFTASRDDGARIQERTAEATPWVGVVMEISLEDGAVDAANDEANDRFEALGQAVFAAGLEIAGPVWTAMRPASHGTNVVEMVLAMPVAGEVPTSFAVPGHPTVTGVLPRRVERYAAFRADEQGVDLLEDVPGGALPYPALIELMEAFDDDPFAETEVRQILADPMAGHIELAATVRVLDA